MHISQTKRSIMAVAAVMIVGFHLWIPVLPAAGLFGQAERFVVGTGYLGVDLFFFLWAYPLFQTNQTSWPVVLRRRFVPLYLTFFLFSTLALAMGKLSFARYASTVTFLDFLQNGGGSFLWFLPALLLMVLLIPLFRAGQKRSPGKGLLLSLVVWAAAAFAVELWLKDVLAIGIFLCRIPVVLLGIFLANYEGRMPPKGQWLLGALLFLPGLLLVYQFGFLHKLQTPLSGMFYLTALPCVLGLLLLLDGLFFRFPSRAAQVLGGGTLELYCTQMLLGGQLVQLFFRWTRSKLLTNVLAFLILWGLSLALAGLRRRIRNR
jgi:peptidoglycan/LPS O-acetylase OafA/YrhL